MSVRVPMIYRGGVEEAGQEVGSQGGYRGGEVVYS